MLSLIRDKVRTASLKARYERQLHEQLCSLTEAQSNLPVAEDPGKWTLIGASERTLTQQEREDARTQSRRLVRNNPHAANILRMLESYVAGPQLQLSHKPDNDAADAYWKEFLRLNAAHYSYREHARRAWRDGEAFLRVFPNPGGPPFVRFIDPELIAPTPEEPESEGIVTDPRDVETPRFYLRIDPQTQQLAERIPAGQMLHTKHGVDSNEKRGNPRLTTVAHTLECYESWTDTELKARKLQASIVLWRKVQGTPTEIETLADNLASNVAAVPRTGADRTPYRQERFKPGTILTTNHATEIEFLQPKTNLRDAVPLGRMLLLAASAGAGMPEFMVTSDASNANYASTMIAEGPAVKLFEAEQDWFRAQLTLLWWLVTGGGFATDPHWQFPTLVNRDKHRERASDHESVDRHIISRAEACRRDGVDPDEMRAEIESEKDLEPEQQKPKPGDGAGGDPSARFDA